MNKSGFFSELRRRQMYRGGVMYVVGGWVIVQVATTLFPLFSIPDWAIRLVVVVVMVGFPLALIGLWMFESTATPVDEPATHLGPTERRAARPESAQGGAGTAASDLSNVALAEMMEKERLERQRANEQLIAALGEFKSGAPDPKPYVAPPTPTPMPAYYPVPPAKRRPRMRPLLLIGVFILIVASWGTWTLISPSIDAQALANTDKLAHHYVMPAYKQVEQVGAALLRPVLQKLGIHIPPAQAFTSIMLLLALLVMRNLYFKMSAARHRARRVEGR